MRVHVPPLPPQADHAAFEVFWQQWYRPAFATAARVLARWNEAGDVDLVHDLAIDVLCESFLKPFHPDVPYRLAKLAAWRARCLVERARRDRAASLPVTTSHDVPAALLREHDGFAWVDWADAPAVPPPERAHRWCDECGIPYVPCRAAQRFCGKPCSMRNYHTWVWRCTVRAR